MKRSSQSREIQNVNTVKQIIKNRLQSRIDNLFECSVTSENNPHLNHVFGMMKATDSKKDWKVTILNVGNLE